MNGGSALIVSEYALDAMAYNEVYESVTWETSTLRGWLNQKFYDMAFGTKEKDLIITINTRNERNPNYGTGNGKKYGGPSVSI